MLFDSMNAPRPLRRLALFSFIIYLSLLIFHQSVSAQALDQSEQNGAPDLQILDIYGNFEIGRPSSIFVLLQNNAAPGKGAEGTAGTAGTAGAEGGAARYAPGLERETARSLAAELLSSDDRIEILSGPQMAGLLPAGEDVTVQFSALVKGAPPGIYPLELRLNYSRLSGVIPSREEGLTSFAFAYERLSKQQLIQAEVVQGAKIVLEEAGDIAAGGESKIRLAASNRGDEPAWRLQLQARPSPPFLMVENGADETSIEPGGSSDLRLSVFTDENATSGYYALPCTITYWDEGEPGQAGLAGGEAGRKAAGDGGEEDGKQYGEQRREELVALVYVGERGGFSWLYLVGAGLVLLLLAGGLKGLGMLLVKSRRLRIVKR